MLPRRFIATTSALALDNVIDMEKDYLLFADALDVRFLAGPAEHYKRYQTQFVAANPNIYPVIVQGDPTCFCDKECNVYRKRSSFSKVHNQIYPNTGWYFSRANELMNFWKDTLPVKSRHGGIDQGWVCTNGAKLYAAHTFHVDYRSILSKNMNLGGPKLNNNTVVKFDALFQDGQLLQCTDNLKKRPAARKLVCTALGSLSSSSPRVAPPLSADDSQRKSWLSVHFSGPAKLYMETTTQYLKENHPVFDYRGCDDDVKELLDTLLLVRYASRWVNRTLGDMCGAYVDLVLRR